MIPSPGRIRATRRWAMGEAVAIAVGIALLALALHPAPAGLAGGLLLGAGVGALIHRRETRLLRRRLALMARPFPPAWEAILRERIPYYLALAPAERERFQQLVAIFLAEKPIAGIGCAVDDTCRLLVAASAVIPIFAFPAWEYDTLRKILIRPEAFDADFRAGNRTPAMALGMVGASGLFDGVMILSRPELYAGFSAGAGKHHVGIHEFAHLIDQGDGAIDGIPATLPRECLRPWTTLVHDHLAHVAGTGAGIPAYGYTNEAEFFAVVSEYFFQSPAELARRDPQLHALLQRIFGQQPHPAAPAVDDDAEHKAGPDAH